MQTRLHTIYKTTNLVNKKIYIGKHTTSSLDDDYLGSGKLLHRAIKKYGVENFHKEILHVFDNENEMNAREKEIVTAEFVLQESNYNLCVGGNGGFGYINSALADKMKSVRMSNLAKVPKETLRENAYRTIKNRKPRTTPCFTREQQIANAAKAWTDGARDKRSATRNKIKFQQGENNSQYGTRWITDGTINKKIKKSECIPEGWHLGRKKVRNIP
jgi:hypothetical protein